MFYRTDRKSIVDYDPTLEEYELWEFMLPKWGYTNSEWVSLIVKRNKLRDLIQWEKDSYKKELSYGVVYCDMQTEIGENLWT